ncbi:MAG TPA: AAA family ATPase, partial [Rhizomicrobium sp.]|nr:AAA family ATPase [Rhizomicrobium sp.]
MLATLKIRDLVLIENVALDFAPGLNVLTGETGAGKSILLDALGLAAGARAGGRSSVRNGAAQGSSVAIFDLAKDHPAFALLSGNDIPAEEEIILRRAITADGRTRAFVNDEPVGVGLLRDLGGMLVEIHGQSDDRGLFDNATHRRVLDSFGGNEKLAATVAERFVELEAAAAQLAALKKAAAAAAADADFVRHAADELSALGPEEGEEAKLAAERVLLMNASKIAEDISAATELLGGDRGAESSLAGALKRLSRTNEEARKAAAAAETALEQAFAQTEEARRELEALLSRLDTDGGELERKEDRLHALRAAARKYGVQPDELPRVHKEFQIKLDSLSGSGTGLKNAEAEVAKTRAAFLDVARKLSAARKTTAKKLEGSVVSELIPLKLAHAKFRVALEPLAEDAASANGLERIAFEVATIESAPFGPLTKIASGGELARFSLALKVALSETSPPA